MKPLNIDYVVDIYLNGDSGKEKATQEKASRLKEKGEVVRIFSLKKSKARSVLKLFLMLWLEIRYLLFSIFHRPKPDIIFSRSTFAFGTWAFGKIFHIPVIREVHADFWDEFKILYADKRLLLPVLKIIHKHNIFFSRRADGLIFNNTRLEQHFIENYGIDRNRTITIPNGCDTKRFYPINKEKARRELSLHSSNIYLLFIGAVSKWHGVEYLLKIQQEINKDRNDIILLIAGGHELSESDELKKRFDIRNTFYTGKVDYKTALLYINASDVCLIPVYNIRVSPGSPLKLYDSISCGKPVITQSEMPGYSDITLEHDLGITCDFTNAELSSRIIIDFVEKADFEQYKKHNRQIAIQYLEWDVMIDRWLEFAQKIIGFNKAKAK